MMRPKQKLQRKREQTRNRTRMRQEHHAAEPEPEQEKEAQGVAHLQRLIGNRAVERLVKNGQHTGEFSFRGAPPAVLRKALVEQAATQAGLTPSIQRDELDEILDGGSSPEALDAGTSQGNDGTVTIDPVTQTTYPVAGATLAQAARALGRDEWGRCHWQVDYGFETTGSRVTKVDITLRLTIRMPVWTGYDSASERAKAEWDRMIGALQAHEDRHAEIARTWAPVFKQNMLNQTVRGMRSQYASTRAAVNTEQNTYDTTTNHGQNEGVSLDVSIR